MFKKRQTETVGFIQAPLFDIQWPTTPKPRPTPKPQRATVVKSRKKKQKTARALDCEGNPMLETDYYVDDYGCQHVVETRWENSMTWDGEPVAVKDDYIVDKDDLIDVADQEEDWEYDSCPAWAPKKEKCKPCKVCGKRHFQNCHKCPHVSELSKFKTWEASPCSDCHLGVGDGAKIGHGKVFHYEPGEHDGLYVQPEPIVSEESYEVVLDVIRALSTLSPQEYFAYFEHYYFSKTMIGIGVEMEKIFTGKWRKAKVIEIIRSADMKLAELRQASKILKGKVVGQSKTFIGPMGNL